MLVIYPIIYFATYFEMKATLLTIGDEILIGQITNTNAVWMAQQLNAVGIAIDEMLSVSDDAAHISAAFDHALSRADLVLVTGGLGPTKDDITKTTLAQYFDCAMHFDTAIWDDIAAYMQRRGHPILEAAKIMAMIPDRCTPLPNRHGLAPAMWFDTPEGKILVSMPGVPQEMMKFMELDILPRLRTHYQLPVIEHHTIITAGIAESNIAEKITDIEDQLPPHVKLAYLPAYTGVRLRLTGKGSERDVLTRDIQTAAQAIWERLYPKYAFGTGESTLESTIGQLLAAQNATLVVAESCTGGYVAHRITSVAGSSAYFKGGVVAYSNELKQQLLGVNPDTLALHGAVSEATVREMAQGALTRLNADYAIAISGIAGPDGGTPEKPVGTIWIAIANQQAVYAKLLHLSRSRDANIQLATALALNELRRCIMGI